MKQTPIQFAKEFIDNLKSDTHLDYSKETTIIFSNDILENDPNLEVLKKELSKIGFSLSHADEENCWTLRKSN